MYQFLAFFFGLLGVHNFYAKHTHKGIVQLLISFTCLGMVVTAFWALFEIFTVDRDGDGRAME